MSEITTAAFYNDLSLSLFEAKRLIENGLTDRHSAAHAPVIASIDAHGAPSQRVMIIRAIDWDQRTLRFHTDARSAKIDELQNKPVSVLFYDAASKIQIRLTGTAVVETDGPRADAAWQAATLFARRCYMAENAPGTRSDYPTSGLPAWIEGKQPTESDIEAVCANFALVFVHFDSIEWLYLANKGHRRARWNWIDSHWDGRWLIP
jgi:pyridoxamine 5'-phosphate oxidase